MERRQLSRSNWFSPASGRIFHQPVDRWPMRLTVRRSSLAKACLLTCLGKVQRLTIGSRNGEFRNLKNFQGSRAAPPHCSDVKVRSLRIMMSRPVFIAFDPVRESRRACRICSFALLLLPLAFRENAARGVCRQFSEVEKPDVARFERPRTAGERKRL